MWPHRATSPPGGAAGTEVGDFGCPNNFLDSWTLCAKCAANGIRRRGQEAVLPHSSSQPAKPASPPYRSQSSITAPFDDFLEKWSARSGRGLTHQQLACFQTSAGHFCNASFNELLSFTFNLRVIYKAFPSSLHWASLVIFFLKPPNSFPRSIRQRCSGSEKMEKAYFFTVWNAFSLQKKKKGRLGWSPYSPCCWPGNNWARCESEHRKAARVCRGVREACPLQGLSGSQMSEHADLHSGRLRSRPRS